MARILACVTILSAAGSVLAGDPGGKGDAEEKDPRLYPRVKMETTLGDIILELDAEHCPVTVMNFIWYAEDGFYDGTIFHRVIKDQFIQGGGYLPNLEKKTKGLRPGIPSEWDPTRLNRQWTIAIVRRAGRLNSATTQFYINVDDVRKMDKPQLDGAAYTVFGRVVDGFKTVAKIRDTKTTTSSRYGGTAATIPAEPIIIKSVKVISEFDRPRIEGIATRRIKEVNEAREREELDVAKEVKIWRKKLEAESGQAITETPEGVMYVDLKVGTGISPKPTDTVEIHYTGWLLDGTEVHSSRSRDPYKFRLDEHLRGWVIGIQTMKPGGRRKMIIPEELAFGGYGRLGVVPPRATMIYDIELISVSPPEE